MTIQDDLNKELVGVVKEQTQILHALQAGAHSQQELTAVTTRLLVELIRTLEQSDPAIMTTLRSRLVTMAQSTTDPDEKKVLTRSLGAIASDASNT